MKEKYDFANSIPTQHTSTTTTASASPSPTDTKKNDAAGQVRAFATGGAGIVLLGAMLAGF